MIVLLQTNSRETRKHSTTRCGKKQATPYRLSLGSIRPTLATGRTSLSPGSDEAFWSLGSTNHVRRQWRHIDQVLASQHWRAAAAVGHIDREQFVVATYLQWIHVSPAKASPESKVKAGDEA